MTDQELHLTNKLFFGYTPSTIRSKELEFIRVHAKYGDYRLLSKIYFGLTIEKERGCWINNDWTKYRQMKFNGKTIGLHRLSYLILRGPIFDNKYACHYCDRKGCVNAFHIFQGTQQDNLEDYKLKNTKFINNFKDNSDI